MEPLDEAIRASGAAAYVAYASSADADMLYLTRFRTTDPIVFLKKPGERGTMVVSQMEYERGVRESTAAVMTRADAGLSEILKEEKDRTRAYARMIAGLSGGEILVPPQFPVGLARELEQFHRVAVDRGTVAAMRAVKRTGEVREIRKVVLAAEAAVSKAIRIIARATVTGGILHRNGKPLTSEAVRQDMHTLLLARGCRAQDTIVACGQDSAVPHLRGAGPLREGEPIIIDLFPQDEISGYCADLSRTVVKGEPDVKVAEMYRAVHEAQQLAASMAQPGVEGAALHQAVVEFFAEQGFESSTRGFIHSLGHGIGLEVHENPSLGPGGGPLEAGNVFTLEPGLYYPEVGGVRLEDMALLTPRGCTLLSKLGERLGL
ncbi:MAG: Xaa-Pro peptidase family protein [Methanomicrobiales archaeon]|nr:Xaa-Pro peptidase family protein [Methanomicrobiales archaeon]